MSGPSASFHQLRVAAFESRRAAEITRLIEQFGGAPCVTPSVRVVPLSDAVAVTDFGHRLLVGEIGVVIFLTGVGFEYLLATVERQIPRERYLHALADIVTIARGPKVVHAMRQVGLQPTCPAAEPHTWREVLAAVDQQIRVDNQVVAIQEYGESNVSLVAGLEARGARVVTVPVYRWDLPEDRQPLEDAVRSLATRRVDVVLFSAAVQITHLLQVARQLGMADQLRQALGDEALFLANANDRKTPQPAPYLNGYFMECYKSQTKQDWQQITETLAWAEEPEMGTSIHSIPFFASFSAIALLSQGGDVLVSMRIWPFRAPARMPSLPSTALMRASQLGMDRITRSAPLTASFADRAGFRPRGTRLVICFLRMSKPFTL